ncbi:MAG: hypothetical protein JXK05_02935 [Campylobacterales bacterium]|nr:hypothetical protein [Campylobacterales bacterium]
MEAINPQTTQASTSLYALKEASKGQGEQVLKLLESSATPQASGAALRGIGTQLDVKA